MYIISLYYTQYIKSPKQILWSHKYFLAHIKIIAKWVAFERQHAGRKKLARTRTEFVGKYFCLPPLCIRHIINIVVKWTENLLLIRDVLRSILCTQRCYNNSDLRYFFQCLQGNIGTSFPIRYPYKFNNRKYCQINQESSSWLTKLRWWNT
jgi:hypothetical protein